MERENRRGLESFQKIRKKWNINPVQKVKPRKEQYKREKINLSRLPEICDSDNFSGGFHRN